MFTVLIDGSHIGEAFFNSRRAIDKAVEIMADKDRPIKECITVRDFNILASGEIVYGKTYFCADYTGKGFQVKE